MKPSSVLRLAVFAALVAGCPSNADLEQGSGASPADAGFIVPSSSRGSPASSGAWSTSGGASSSAQAASSSAAATGSSSAPAPSSSAPSSSTSTPTCDADAVTGDYCGGDKVTGGSADTLYRCTGPGPAVVKERCALGCFVSPPGDDDLCKVADPTCDANASTGDYCAGDKVSHGLPLVLYRCNGPGPATLKQNCPGGCVVAPAGQDDYCATVTPTCDANASTGDYCGGDKVSHADSTTLYRCNGPGPATVRQDCTGDCVVAPAGQDDYCATVPSAVTCDANASTGDYCGTDKITGGARNTLYRCTGPGPATVVRACPTVCVIAPAGQDDYCQSSCGHASLLKWGLCPDASDRLRCAGVSAGDISQTIGDAPASAGYHAQDGTIGGAPYCAATDISVSGMTDTQVHALVDTLTTQGFAAFYRKPGHDGWPSYGARHVHAVYAGVAMKSQLRGQVSDFLVGLNGLASHTAYTFFQPTASQKAYIRALFNAHN